MCRPAVVQHTCLKGKGYKTGSECREDYWTWRYKGSYGMWNGSIHMTSCCQLYVLSLWVMSFKHKAVQFDRVSPCESSHCGECETVRKTLNISHLCFQFGVFTLKNQIRYIYTKTVNWSNNVTDKVNKVVDHKRTNFSTSPTCSVPLCHPRDTTIYSYIQLYTAIFNYSIGNISRCLPSSNYNKRNKKMHSKRF